MSPRIAIIGAGFGGIGVALKLRAAGHHDVVVYERAPAIGGTWHYNTYPGAACDAPSHVYSYSFAQDVTWSRRFAPGDEILAYLQRCVTDGGIADLIQTGTEVTGAHWIDGQWSIDLSDGRTDHADVLIPALGQLNVPAAPSITGLNRFRGTSFHSARWRDDVSLAGKRVAVIGTGASAIQIFPTIADDVEHLTVFQRSAPYVLSKPDAPYSDRVQRWYRSAPLLRSVARRMIWTYLEMATVGFDRFPKTLGVLQRYHGRILAGEVADPALRAKLQPDHRIGCKRILISNDYYATLARPDVTLATDPIQAVTEDGILTGSDFHPVDVIVFATGFETTPMLSSMRVVGRSGIALSDRWSEREGAYLGLSVPDFPNMFLIYGPNTNLGSGSIIYMLEAQADHVVDAVGILARHQGAVVEVTEDAYRKFMADNDRAHRRAVWAGCRSWYQDAAGRNTHNWPWTMTSYRRRTRRVDHDAYLVSSGS